MIVIENSPIIRPVRRRIENLVRIALFTAIFAVIYLALTGISKHFTEIMVTISWIAFATTLIGFLRSKESVKNYFLK